MGAIFIPVETAVRELPYKLILSIMLAQKGHAVVMGDKAEVSACMQKQNEFTYLDKGYHQGISENIYRFIKERNGVIINLDEEGGVDFKEMDTIRKRYPPAIFKWADAVLLWGKKQQSILQDSIPDYWANKITISGHPRFQMLGHNFQNLYTDAVHKLQKTYGDFVLINTNMGFGNNVRGSEFVVGNYGSRIHDIAGLMADDRSKLTIILELVTKLRLACPFPIVVRPHPEEDHATYREAFKNLKDTYVSCEGSVIPWILASRFMLHTDCTTGIEAALLGKAPLSIMPSDISHVTELPRSISIQFHQVDEVISYLNKHDWRPPYHVNLEILDTCFSLKLDSFSIVADALSRLTRQTTNPDESLHYGLFTIFHSIFATFKKIIKPLDALDARKRKGLFPRQVLPYFKSLRRFISNASDVKIVRINRMTYLLCKQS